jgi:hypothetical protein
MLKYIHQRFGLVARYNNFELRLKVDRLNIYRSHYIVGTQYQTIIQ